MRGHPVTGWRKIAGAAWGAPCDPQVYGELDVDAGPLLTYLEKVRRESGVHVTVTHLVGRAVAHALAVCPEANGLLVGGRFVPRRQVDVFFIATLGQGRDLSGVKVEHADAKPVTELATELAQRLGAMADGDDPELGRGKALLTAAPVPLLRLGLRLGAWLTADRGWDLPRLGLPREAFGGAMISSVGMFGLQRGYAPLAAFYRVPLLVLVGEVAQRPVAVNGTVVVRPVLPLSATLDHRYLDVAHAARLADAVREYCHDPASFEPA